ncbi:MAG: SpoIIE family protein phosphatase [Lachnospiraceae bacterium]|nr:SpoIIE family protein phosphatase [Lachnospiraceae bacterium]MDE6972353.1 SpoIIE family protein phosphatase [Lachnospiraceae bacterium]
MKKQSLGEREEFGSILPEYGRRKLLTYADSIRELADSFKETEQIQRDGGKNQDRRDYVWQKRLNENKELMVTHLEEMAQIMLSLAEETRRCIPMGERRFKQIAHALREVGIQIKNLYLIENEMGHMEVSLTMKNMRADTLSSEEIGDLLSVLLNMHLVSAGDNAFFIGEEWQTYYFVQEAKFHVLTGVAKAVKETEKISGDNYAFFEGNAGNLTAVLSDGMGSGEKACTDSTMVVELMQKFLEAGFQMEVAIQMINSALLAGGENANMSTLDLCSLDLYNGECRFVKVGSACSYIKRQHLVDRISSGNLPLGIFQKPDTEAVGRTLMDGDYVIMVSDGILDALSQGIGEDMLSELIGGSSLENPGEMANAILNFCIHQCRGHIRDDMTVLVIGIWKKDE